jgi:hypothetical protein
VYTHASKCKNNKIKGERKKLKFKSTKKKPFIMTLNLKDKPKKIKNKIKLFINISQIIYNSKIPKEWKSFSCSGLWNWQTLIII